MKNMLYKLLSVSFLATMLAACGSEEKPRQAPPTVAPMVAKKQVLVPRFVQDSAFVFVEKQVAFGPRVPNTAAHKNCRAWLVEKLKAYGASVVEQNFQPKISGGTLNATNIIGSYNPQNPERIVLAAHWDSRHIAESDTKDVDKPILGADDGGSGVGVLLEIARQLGQNPMDLGVDIIFFDAEDHGENNDPNSETWCLGSQHWSKNPHVAGYTAKYGILLDMVGGKDARFPKDGVSMEFAAATLNKVWQVAQNIGNGNYFVNDAAPSFVDDHFFVNKLAKIPMIDIINLPANNGSKLFPTHHHTHDDNMTVIDRRTLRAVGQTLLAVVYGESNGTL